MSAVATASLPTVPELEKKTIPELEKILDDFADKVPKPKLKEVMVIRNRKIREENAIEYGLTADEYDKIKKEAVDANLPLIAVLTKARKNAGRALQQARAGTVGTKATAAGTK